MNYTLQLIQELDRIHFFINVTMAIQIGIIFLLLGLVIINAFRGIRTLNIIDLILKKYIPIKNIPKFIIIWIFFLIFVTCIGLKISLPTTEDGYELYFSKHSGVSNSDPYYKEKYIQFRDSIKNGQLEE